MIFFWGGERQERVRDTTTDRRRRSDCLCSAQRKCLLTKFTGWLTKPVVPPYFFRLQLSRHRPSSAANCTFTMLASLRKAGTFARVSPSPHELFLNRHDAFLFFFLGRICGSEALPFHPRIPVRESSQFCTRSPPPPLPSLFALSLCAYQYGVPTPKGVAAKTPKEAVEAFNKVSGPSAPFCRARRVRQCSS